MCICKALLLTLGFGAVVMVLAVLLRPVRRSASTRRQGSDFFYVRKQTKTPGDDRAFSQRIQGLFPELRHLRSKN